MAERVMIPQPMPNERVVKERWRWGILAAATFLCFWNLFAANLPDFPAPRMALGAAIALFLFAVPWSIWLYSRAHWFPPLPAPQFLRDLPRRHPSVAAALGFAGPFASIGTSYFDLPRSRGAGGIVEAGAIAMAITLLFAASIVTSPLMQRRAPPTTTGASG